LEARKRRSCPHRSIHDCVFMDDIFSLQRDESLPPDQHGNFYQYHHFIHLKDTFFFKKKMCIARFSLRLKYTLHLTPPSLSMPLSHESWSCHSSQMSTVAKFLHGRFGVDQMSKRSQICHDGFGQCNGLNVPTD
jgi:hypothetical protein